MKLTWTQLGPDSWESCSTKGLKLQRLADNEWLLDNGKQIFALDQTMVFDSESRIFVQEEPVHSAADPFKAVRVVSLGPHHFTGGVLGPVKMGND